MPCPRRAQLGILTGNYGEAGAINLYGPAYDLPKAISGINSYWLRGYSDPLPQTLIVLGLTLGQASQIFRTCEIAGHITNPYDVMNEPTFGQLESDLRISAARMAEIVAVLQERGEIVKIAADLAFDQGVLTSVEARLRKRLSETREISAAEFRDLLGASRKYSIPLLDCFDRTGVTVRTGDLRRLRET